VRSELYPILAGAQTQNRLQASNLRRLRLPHEFQAPHLLGRVRVTENAITTRLFELGWISRGHRRRSVVVTRTGRQGLADSFGWRDAS
jgi:hypothetical protein